MRSKYLQFLDDFPVEVNLLPDLFGHKNKFKSRAIQITGFIRILHTNLFPVMSGNLSQGGVEYFSQNLGKSFKEVKADLLGACF
jgi:hypothetical protein